MQSAARASRPSTARQRILILESKTAWIKDKDTTPKHEKERNGGLEKNVKRTKENKNKK